MGGKITSFSAPNCLLIGRQFIDGSVKCVRSCDIRSSMGARSVSHVR